MNFSWALVAILLLGSLSAQATDSQFFFQARKNQFFLTPMFVAAHEDYASGVNSVLVTNSTRRDYGMNFFVEYGLSDSFSFEGGVGGTYNTYHAVVQDTYHSNIAYAAANALSLRLKGRAELTDISFRYGLDVRVALDSEPERALWDWGTEVSPYVGIQTSYDQGVVGLLVSVDAFRSSRKFINGFTVTTTSGKPSVLLTAATVDGGQKLRALIFAEGDDRAYDVGIAVGMEHHLKSTIESQTFREVENNIFVRGYVVYEFLPKVNFVLDAHGIIGEKSKTVTFEEMRRSQVLVMAGVRMEL